MKVKDIIQELSKIDPETEASFQMADGCCGDVEFLNISDLIIENKDSFHREDRAIFFFEALWFLTSCRRSGAAKDAAKKVIGLKA